MLYKILVTASSAVLSRGRSVAGKGGGLIRCEDLYLRADVESPTGGGGLGIFCSDRRRADEEKARELSS